MTFGLDKLEWYDEKMLKTYLFVSTESTNVTDGQVDGQTDGHRMRT